MYLALPFFSFCDAENTGVVVSKESLVKLELKHHEGEEHYSDLNQRIHVAQAGSVRQMEKQMKKETFGMPICMMPLVLTTQSRVQ